MKRLILAIALAAASSQVGAVLVCSNYTDHTAGTWYTTYPTSTLDNVDTVGDVECYADGNELTYIRQRFPTLRMRTGTNVTVYWRGDDAAFLLENL